MTPEEKEEFKALVKEALRENVEEQLEKIISPIVDILHIYKDVEINEETEKYIAEVQLDEAETVKVTKKIKWSQVLNISETTKTDQDLFQVKNLYKLLLNSGPIYCEIKDIKKFEDSWEEAILAYGFV